MPLGNYRELAAMAVRKKDGSANAWKAGLFNYRTWVMTILYGYCFGVELVVDNVITYYVSSGYARTYHTTIVPCTGLEAPGTAGLRFVGLYEAGIASASLPAAGALLRVVGDSVSPLAVIVD